MSMRDSWLDKWDAMDPDVQKKWKIAGVVLVLLVMAIVVQKMSAKDKTPFERTKVETTMMLPENSKMDMENLHSEMYRMSQENKDMKRRMEQQDQIWAKRFQEELANAKDDGKLGNPQDQETLNRLKAELEDLKSQQAVGAASGVTAGRNGKPAGPNMAGALPSPNMKVGAQPGAVNIDTPIPSYDPLDANAPMPSGAGLGLPEEPVTGLRITSATSQPGEASGGAVPSGDATTPGAAPSASKAATVPAQKKEEEAWVPAGSIIQGVLLSGLDAPTSSHAQKNPTPIVIRIKKEAILPNFFKVDIRECFIIASGYGVMSTERANFRTETLTCVRHDGGIIETALQGYGIGEDGKAGLRGRLVTKQGALLAKSMTAGFFSGLADAAKPTAVAAVNTSPGSSTGYQSPDFENLMASGLGEGAATALNQVSKFYLDMAKEMFPVIEIDAGRNIEIVLVKGTGLKLRSKSGATGNRSSRRG